MVSFNRNIANGQLFPFPRSSNNRCRANSIALRLRHDWLAEVTDAWHQLLSTVGNLRLSTTANIPSSRNVICTQPDFSKAVISILNRFQLLMWMYENQADNLGSSDSKDDSAERIGRIQDSIQRDLLRLRKLVNESSFQSRLSHRTELTEHLENFFRRLQP